jgi:hypothetical protein
VSASELAARMVSKLAGLPLHTKVLLALATSLFLTELLLRRLAPRSRVYARWKVLLEAIGVFWTAIILSVVYFLSVSLASAFLKLLGRDPLDRRLEPEVTFWRPHEANPLGPRMAARHQF